MQIIQQHWREQRLAVPGRHTFLPYYTNPPWLAGEERFLFFTTAPDFSRPQLGIYNPALQRIEQQIELSGWEKIKPEFLVDTLIGSTFWHEKNQLLVPCGPDLYGISLLSGEKQLLWQEEQERDGWIGGTGTISPDGKFYSLLFLHPPRTAPARGEMLVFELPDFRLIRRHDFGSFLVSHFQFLADPEYIMYAHEGPTRTIFDRLNRIHWPSGRRECLHRHLCDLDSGELLECIGHEMAASRGNLICAVRYPDSRIRSAILLLDQDGANCRELDCDDYWHVSCNPDGTVLAADTMWWGHSRRRTEHQMDIIRLDTRARTKEIVKTVHSVPSGQHRHPHPQLDSTGRRLLFMENSPESDQLASITLAELTE